MRWRTNKLLDLKKQYKNELLAFYEKDEADSLLFILIQHFFGLSRSALLSRADFRLSESEMLKLHFAVKDLRKYCPVQYITGETEFFGLTIKVNEAVLIPRPETEELVQLILDTEKEAGLNILDVGTGSGCISIALAKNMKDAHLVAIDNSSAVLEVAKANCAVNGLNISLQEIDILDYRTWTEPDEYDLIVSNPPYVTQNEKRLMKENVLKYEPRHALFVPDNDALVFYKAILKFAKNHLARNGKVYFEINETKGNEIVNLLNTANFKDIRLHKDIHGKDRFASARRQPLLQEPAYSKTKNI